MKIINKPFLALIARKNRQIRFERERCSALEQTNSILSAYVGLLVAKCGGAVVPRSLVSQALGKYRTSVTVEGDCYVISVQCDDRETDMSAAESIATYSEAAEIKSGRSEISDGGVQI